MRIFKFILLALIIVFLSFSDALATGSKADTTVSPLQNSFRIQLINPGVNWQWVTSENSILSLNSGFSFAASYWYVKDYVNSFNYEINPLITIQHLWLYNRKKRFNNGRITEGNSGNFVSVKLVTIGPPIVSNFAEKTELGFAIGPSWGMQRKYGRYLSFLFEMGPGYFIDIKGNSQFYFFNPRLTIGLILK